MDTLHFDVFNYLSDACRKTSCDTFSFEDSVYLHVTTDNKRRSITSDLLTRTAVSEAQALKEKHMVKYGDVFSRCLQSLTQLVTEIAEECNLSGPYAVISQDGLEQVAALLPRTNSDLVQVDSMTLRKVEKYGARVMATLKPFWKEVDDRDEAEMREQLEKLKQHEPAPPMPSIPSIDVESSTSPSSIKPRFTPRFGRANSGRGRGAATVSRARVTPRVRKKVRRGSSQGSSGGTRTKRARPSFKPPTRDRGSKMGRATPSLNPMLFPV
uniref:HRDC domain-containing protein n=1 Tax=Angiostrongylus cantonensis TaxID=6313 RepID=A0A158PC77_ANGCA